MIKNELINAIIEESKIHHNIRVNFSKLPDYKDDEYDQWQDIAQTTFDQFKENWENYSENPINDTGNRNIGKDCEIKGEVWATGRGGATAYWDAYWDENSSFKYDEYALQEMSVTDLRSIWRDVKAFNQAIDEMMFNFYGGCHTHLTETRLQQAEEELEEISYQTLLKTVKEKHWIKRLINDTID